MLDVDKRAEIQRLYNITISLLERAEDDYKKQKKRMAMLRSA